MDAKRGSEKVGACRRSNRRAGHARTRAESRGRGFRGGRHRAPLAGEIEQGGGPSGPRADTKLHYETSTHEDHEDEMLNAFCKRKVESNWSRYETAEQEDLSEEHTTRRGTDYHALLGSAGGSFSQFRLAEEKDWIIESFSICQMSVVPVDLKELALSLQKLPLALRLNLEQKQMQVPFPVEFPATSRKPKLEAGIIGQVRPVEKMQTDNCGCLLPATALHNVSDSKENDPPQISKSRPLTEHLNEELDFLLTSHTPGKNLNESQGIEFCKGKTSVPVLDLEGDLKLQPFEADQIKSDTGTRREATEDLEDWLDTMIL